MALDAYLPLAERRLAEIPGWMAVGELTRRTLLAAGTLRRHEAGAVLQRRGDAIDQLLFVVDGSLEVSMQGAGGRRAVCWFLEPGQFMGVIPLIDGRGGIHDARAHTEAIVLHIPKVDFMAALRRDPVMMETMLQILCDRARAMYETAAAESLLTLKSRVARTIGLLAASHGRPTGQGIELTLKLAQDELADMLGVTRQSLNRELKALEAAGALSLAYARIEITDAAALAAFANATR